ncbi:hypothetical protein [Amycolatopsis anabasis]|uniref:hypothetical protein n=1 Tax=Amycolatopsis anabasis TaxID=1840409 RepID=UPI00131DFC7E|nr:hypothetical protein [Amycolatopsis anabasis]
MKSEEPDPSEITIHSDNYTIDVPASHQRRRRNYNAPRIVVMLVFGWSIAMLTAVVAAGVISFLEVQRACENGLGDTGTSTAEVTFRSAIAVTCHTPDSTIEIPMNGAAATILFGGFGLVVTLLLMIAYAAFRSRQPAQDDR